MTIGTTHNDTDVLIAGCGFAGLTLAIALRQALGPSFGVIVADPALGRSHDTDERASAIVAATRPVFLTFGGDIEPGEQFAHMIENRHLVAALEDKARDCGVELLTGAVKETGGGENAGRIVATLADGGTIAARLLVAADGARSTIRQAAGIATHGWNYGQSAIVINVAHERDHNGRAEEHFLP